MSRCQERSIQWMWVNGFSRVAILNALLSYGYNPMVAELYVERFEAKNKIKIS